MAQRCTRTLVVNVQGGNDTLGDDPGVETARPARVHASAEDQLHLAWSTDVEAFTNDLLEEQPACRWPVEHLRQGKLRLQKRDLVPVSGLAIGGGLAGAAITAALAHLPRRRPSSYPHRNSC